MKFVVHVKPRSRQESVELLADGTYVVRVNAPPIDGRANDRVVELLADFLQRPVSSIILVSGHRGKRKIFEIS